MKNSNENPIVTIFLLSIITITAALLLEIRNNYLPPPEPAKSEQSIAGQPLPKESISLSDASITMEEPKEKVIRGVLKRGETIGKSLGRCSVPDEITTQIISLFDGHINFQRLQPGNTFRVELDAGGELQQCTYECNPFEVYSISKTTSGFETRRLPALITKKVVNVSGILENSLFSSFESLGERQELVLGFAEIFKSNIDFNTEPQKGDRFSMVVEKYFKNEEFVGYGRILAARYEAVKKVFEGYYYAPEGIPGNYYDHEGKELGTSFIRSPLPFGKVTSTFTKQRLHPILGGIRPHLGVDLAAPQGTPIMAAGNGTVEAIGYNGGYGKQIILTHGSGLKTFYGHLSQFKKDLKKGDRVEQKEIIGYVGSTGLSTGPHLDYRIEKNGTFKNPFALTFTPKSILASKDIKRFQDARTALAKLIDPDSDYKVLRVENLTVENKDSLFLL